ncbi:MAG: AEC family transporter [Epsilonproteobacteria bacterium]|nr:transporter [Campylobacterota bacterium]NPA57611.1 AEC family transporter [Campylobacterota bacterium]
MESFKAVFFVYLFIAIGFLAKKWFRERIDERTLVLLSVYIFQPFLTFWGLLKRPLDLDLVVAPIIFFLISLAVVLANFLIGKRLFSDPKDRSIFTVASVIGNTGNLGVPLGLALFGEASLPYTTIVNLANVFMVYSVGAYFYSRGSFSVRDSMVNTLKLPILWFALAALILSAQGFRPEREFDLFLQMGSYTAIVLQLIIFGVYLARIRLSHIDLKLAFSVSFVKFIALPALAYLVLQSLSIEGLAKGVLFMELAMPLAVANVNLAALYRCKELTVTALIFITSLLFLPLLPFYIEIVGGFR